MARQTIWKRMKARKEHKTTWRIEGTKWSYGAKIKWSRSTPQSALVFSSGCLFNDNIDLGAYDRRYKEYSIEFPKDTIHLFPTEIILTTPGIANVLIALDVEMDDERLRPIPKGEIQTVTAEQLEEFPVLPLEITSFASEMES
ncbi:hypothetical protein [Synechococcus sp. RS9916]|uniref:hypothetical protein n=1 Tax=Synechococcus sp. RS9916 TaxID=221359 RepID=UPI0012EA5B5F|nr:hypothetical protein [Synechococcus sp. RS9916]